MAQDERLRRMGHAARNCRRRPGMRDPSARQAGTAGASRAGGRCASKRQSSRILAGCWKPALVSSDDEPPLADRDGPRGPASRAGIPTLDELITILVMGREPSLATQVVEAF
jgi:hypothetical protein